MTEAKATPESYAKRLAGYIRDPSTIRVRTLEQFGRAPTIERISRYQVEHKRVRAKPHNTYLQDRFDGTKFDVRENEQDDFVPRENKSAPKAITETPIVFCMPPWKLMGANAVEIITTIAEAFGLSYGELIGKSRDAYIVRVRALAVTLLCDRGNSTPQVGRWIRRDHSTVLHAKSMLPIYIKEIPELGKAYTHFRKEWGIDQ